jgi:hypothetical protein
MRNFPIADIVNKKDKLMSITLTDKRGDMFDLVMPYMNPAKIYEQGFIKVAPGEALIRRLSLKDSHLISTRKEREFVIQTSIAASETFYNTDIIDCVNVIDRDNDALYASLQKAVKEIIEKIDKEEKEMNKDS